MTVAEKESTKAVGEEEIRNDGVSDEQAQKKESVETGHAGPEGDAKPQPEADSESAIEDQAGIDGTGAAGSPVVAESIKAELGAMTERLQRQAAEFQNYRRRTEKEKGQMVHFGKAVVIQQLLDVFDDFHRSIESANDSGNNGKNDIETAFASFRSGVEMAYQKLMDELKKLGVEAFESVGEPFDEELHEAVMQQPAEEGGEAGIVLAEIQRGFRMNDRILRHAKVVVSTVAPDKDDA